MFETFDHTADIGLRVTAATREELFIEAARGLTSLLVDNTQEIHPTVGEVVQLSADSLDDLLFDWLNELLFRFETRAMLFCQFDVRIVAQRLTGMVQGEPCDRSRHQLAHEVKAITYHGLSVEQSDTGWRAELVLDI
jgi:SHS2 domain-containing protein